MTDQSTTSQQIHYQCKTDLPTGVPGATKESAAGVFTIPLAFILSWMNLVSKNLPWFPTSLRLRLSAPLLPDKPGDRENVILIKKHHQAMKLSTTRGIKLLHVFGWLTIRNNLIFHEATVFLTAIDTYLEDPTDGVAFPHPYCSFFHLLPSFTFFPLFRFLLFIDSES